MIDKLVKKIKETKAPIVVGLDPMLSYVPEYIKKTAFDEYGETLEGAAEAIWQYNKGIVDAVHDLIPAVKPQIAMYEQFGIEGLKVFQKTVDYCKSKDLVVIAEVKTRTNPAAAAPREAVDVHKRRRILMAARQFLTEHPDFTQRQIRFDVVEVVPCPGGWQVRCFPGAFEAGG